MTYRFVICGDLGSGKTLLAIILGYFEAKNGRKVLSNTYTNYGEYLSPLDMLNFGDNVRNCFIIIDEAEVWIDSRINTKANRLLSYFTFQSRKRDVDICYVTQLASAIDLRMRYICSRIVECNTIQLDRELWGKDPINLDNIEAFEYLIKNTEGDLINTQVLSFNNAKQFFPMYDTTKIIMPLELGGEEYINWDEVMESYSNGVSQKAFTSLIRKTYPFITYDDASSVYQFIKNDDIKKAKRILGLKDNNGKT